jgi:hypothetical protein
MTEGLKGEGDEAGLSGPKGRIWIWRGLIENGCEVRRCRSRVMLRRRVMGDGRYSASFSWLASHLLIESRSKTVFPTVALGSSFYQLLKPQRLYPRQANFESWPGRDAFALFFPPVLRLCVGMFGTRPAHALTFSLTGS